MTDDSTALNGAGPVAQPQIKMQVLGQFIRDLSFENAVAQRGLQGGEVTPDTTVVVSLTHASVHPSTSSRSSPSSRSPRRTS